MIPKIIHYCWISGEENMPDDIKACIESWHKYLPDYEFINWNDSNFDWNVCEYAKKSRENNLYAFCSDYVRFWALYNYGGIYLDSDVMVYKSFDELLKMKRIVTREVTFNVVEHFEAAIVGCEKGDSAFGKIVKYYNKCGLCPPKEYTIAPHAMLKSWSSYKINDIFNIKDEIKYENVINVLKVHKYFDSDSEHAFAQHNFKSSWTSTPSKTCLNNDEANIFLYTKGNIKTYIPKCKKYIILTSNKSLSSDFHDIIYFNENKKYDDEVSAFRFLYDNKDKLPNYVCFNHLHNLFKANIGQEKHISKWVDRNGVIVTKLISQNKNKYVLDSECLRIINHYISENKHEYISTFNNFINDNVKYIVNNSFAMSKENFLKMCETIFKIVDSISGRNNLNLIFNYLIELYCRKNFDINNSYQSQLCIPNKTMDNYE